MMSVGAERDPYLQAYIQARMKNHVEEVKLQKVLANLEVGRRIKKIMLNLELFEDRKIAHKLKQDATDADASKKKVMSKFFQSQKKVHRIKMNMAPQSFNVSLAADTTEVSTTAPTSGTKKRAAIYPVTKGKSRAMSPNTSNSNNSPPTAKSAGHLEIRHAPSIENPSNANVTLATPTSASFSVRVRELTVPVRREHSHQFPSNQNNPNNAEGKCSSTFRRSSTMPQLSTPVVQIEIIHPEGMKTPATIPTRRLRRAPDTRSVRTLPILCDNTSSNPGLVSKTARPQTSKMWPGDPGAIRSVRRERRKPEEMLSLVKNGEEARRMIRDMPPTCSKNCSKPDILQELGRSYTDLPNLLPAIEKARHEFAKKEAASRDLPPDFDNVNATDAIDVANEVMPVSQIQYLALRSMGGVRRNSVIA